MSDITDRLRDLADNTQRHSKGQLWNGLDEAIAEIDQLRARIDELEAERDEAVRAWGLERDKVAQVEVEQRAGVPEGWKLVPVDPTDEICEALEYCLRDHGFDHDGVGELSKAACWDAMLAAVEAAPAPRAQEQCGRDEPANRTAALLLDLADVLQKHRAALGASWTTGEHAQLLVQHMGGDIQNVYLTRSHATAYELRSLAAAQPEQERCWCETCRPVTLTDMRMVLCPDCGNKRCPRATSHTNVCTGSNMPGQTGSAYAGQPAPSQGEDA